MLYDNRPLHSALLKTNAQNSIDTERRHTLRLKDNFREFSEIRFPYLHTVSGQKIDFAVSAVLG